MRKSFSLQTCSTIKWWGIIDSEYHLFIAVNELMGPGMKLPWLLRQPGIAPPDGRIQHYLRSACPKFKPICNPLLDQKNNLQEIQGTKRSFKLHHRDEINKIQMATNSARANNPISSGNKFQGKKEKEWKGACSLKKRHFRKLSCENMTWILIFKKKFQEMSWHLWDGWKFEYYLDIWLC